MGISNILLWVFMTLQMITMFFLIKLVTDFLNRFRLNESQNEENFRKNDDLPIS